MSGNGGWTAAYRWVRIFALSFVLTLAASVAGADPAWRPVGEP